MMQRLLFRIFEYRILPIVRMKKTVVFCCFASLLLSFGCTRKSENAIRLITIRAEKKTTLITYKFPGVVYVADSSDFVSFPVEDGDIILSDDLALIIDKNFQDTISLRSEGQAAYLNEQLYEIRIDTTRKMLSWLDALTEEEVRNTKFLWFEQPPPDSYRPALQRIAKWSPHLGIVLGYDSAEVMTRELHWVGHLFNPRHLMMAGGLKDLTGLTSANFPDLEFLLLSISKEDSSVVLPPMPSIKSLFTFIENSETALHPDFFVNNLQLEKLTITGDGLTIAGPPPWKKLVRLKELNFAAKNMPPYGIARNHPDLQTLVIQEKFKIDSTAGLTKLKWLSIQTPISQQDLDQVPIGSPSIQLLHLLNSDTIQSLGSLGKLSQLKYLIISNEMNVDTSLYSLTGLKYLSVPEKYLLDSARANALRRSLPSTIIAPNSGVCMGSGWLLLLLPLAGALFLLQRPRGASSQRNVS
jgi:hypothetical protein